MSTGFHVRSCKQLATCLLLLGSCAVFIGCNGGAAPKVPNAAEQAKVSGSVSNGGKPITVDSSVVFECPEKSAIAAGKIDSLGKFSLAAGDPGIGIPAGRYSVVVRPPEAAAGPPPAVGSDAYKAKMMQGGAAAPAETKPSDIPTEFQRADTTKLKLDVKAGENKFDIDLSKVSG